MAREESLHIAERRGVVHSHMHRRGNICDLSIISPGFVAFVCAMRLVKLSSTLDDILHDFAAAISRLRLIVSALVVSRELWLRTPRGKWRFFRVLDDGILELAPDGMPIAAGQGPSVAAAPVSGTGSATLHAARGSSGNPGMCGSLTGMSTGAGIPDPDCARSREGRQESGVSDPALTEIRQPAAATGPVTAAPAPVPGSGAGPVYDGPDTLPTGTSIEFIRRFMRWKETKRGKGTGSG
jgi:hypothetical protein